MSEPFTDTEAETSEWVDVRMTDPEKGEWDVDFVVAEGSVEYIDLRIRPDLLSAFLDCLITDVGDDRARELLAGAAERNGIDLVGEV
jgi:hypothetical protein